MVQHRAVSSEERTAALAAVLADDNGQAHLGEKPEGPAVGAPVWELVGAGTLVAIAWAVTVGLALDMGNGLGAMGLGPWAFLGIWAAMMTAMMGPLVLTVAGSARRVSAVVVGYLAVWGVAGVLALGAAAAAGRLAAHHQSLATTAAIGVLIVAAGYQVSPFKDRCLDRCRNPATSSSGTEALREGLRRGGWCLATSWAAMLVLVAFGLMSLAAMVVLAVVLYAERFWLRGRRFRYLTAVASAACAVFVAWSPSLAAGLHHVPHSLQM